VASATHLEEMECLFVMDDAIEASFVAEASFASEKAIATPSIAVA
jgi:hypothetical protein